MIEDSPNPDQSLEVGTAESGESYSLTKLEADVESFRQEMLVYYRTMLESVDSEDFKKRLPPEIVEKAKNAGVSHYRFKEDEVIKYTIAKFENGNEGEMFISYVNNFIGYLPGFTYNKQLKVLEAAGRDMPKWRKIINEVEDIIKGMGLNPEEISKWETDWTIWTEEKGRHR